MGGDGEAVRGERLAEGKTKVVYADPMDPALAVIVHKDDITAGDGARRNSLPGKGALSGRTTSNVFRLLRASGIPTHFIDAPAADPGPGIDIGEFAVNLVECDRQRGTDAAAQTLVAVSRPGESEDPGEQALDVAEPLLL